MGDVSDEWWWVRRIVVDFFNWVVEDGGVPGVEVDVGFELFVLKKDLISELDLLSDLTKFKLWQNQENHSLTI